DVLVPNLFWQNLSDRQNLSGCSNYPFTKSPNYPICHLPLWPVSDIIFTAMYEDFHATDRWTAQKLHCLYQALIVAIATRHADAVDIKFVVNGQPVWIA